MDETAGTGTGDAEDDVQSVRRLNERIEQQLTRTAELQTVRCRGEVRNINTGDAGIYFDITDGECTLHCVVWHNDYREMNITLESGMQIVIDGAIGYYPERGQLSLYGSEMSVVGKQTATEELETELAARGWFDDTQKTAIPRVPERIGVVTSHHGDARHDITTAIHETAPAVDIVLQHASVQGPNAPQSIADGICVLDRDVDVIIVGRGGGSMTDLQAFNSELVATAIHDAETPIVAAVGHTTDQLIADRVADAAVTTPREAGEQVVAGHRMVWGRLNQLEASLDDAYDRAKREHEQELKQAASTDSHTPLVYKAAIVVLLLLVIGLGLLLLL